MNQLKESSISDVYETLFHYTNELGLYGILSSKSLWATHFRFLNDSEEFSLFKKAIRKVLEIECNFSNKEEYIEEFEEILSKYTKVLEERAPAYLSCFCPAREVNANSPKEDDFNFLNGRLSQWRGYGKDSGYAIEFDTKKLEEILQKESSGNTTTCDRYLIGIRIATVGYIYQTKNVNILKRDGDQETIKFIESSLNNLIINFLQAFNQYYENKDLTNVSEMMELVATCASRIKHYGFHEENEIRIVVMANTKEHLNSIQKENNNIQIPQPKEVFFRSHDNAPYIILFDEFKELFEQSVRGVVIGPGSHQQIRKQKVEMIIKKFGYKNVEVRCSDIPFNSHL